MQNFAHALNLDYETEEAYEIPEASAPSPPSVRSGLALAGQASTESKSPPLGWGH